MTDPNPDLTVSERDARKRRDSRSAQLLVLAFFGGLALLIALNMK